MARASLKDVDHGFRELLRNVQHISASVDVGVDNRPHFDDDGHYEMPTDTLGAIHEFGTETVPKRSFLRGWVNKNTTAIRAMLRGGAQEVASGRLTWAGFQKRIGEAAVESVRSRMIEGIHPPLERRTVQRRIFGQTPLVDSRQLLDAITHRPSE